MNERRSSMPCCEETEARIVAWLLKSGSDAADTLRQLHQKQTLTRAQTKEWEQMISLYASIATALQRGDHRASHP